MAVEPGIWCSCGHRIRGQELLQQGFVMIQHTPVFVYLQYRCPQCNRTEERLIEYEKWDPAMLGFPEDDLDELARQGPLPPISLQEIAEFAERLERVSRRDFESLRST